MGADIHCVGDIAALPFTPQMVNFKPSRIGGLQRLLDAHEYVAAKGIGADGGGMYELGPGCGQIEYLAPLFHPDAPNDDSPAGFLRADVPDGRGPTARWIRHPPQPAFAGADYAGSSGCSACSSSFSRR
jgi:hypothetical protein